MDQFSEEQIDFDVDTVICNKLVNNPGHIKNFLCLVTKQYIYRKRCLKQPLNFYELKKEIYQLQNTEKYITVKNSMIHRHLKKWYSHKNQEASPPHPGANIDKFIQQYIVSL